MELKNVNNLNITQKWVFTDRILADKLNVCNEIIPHKYFKKYIPKKVDAPTDINNERFKNQFFELYKKLYMSLLFQE